MTFTPNISRAQGGVPLWIGPHNLPSPADIPHCERCGAPREFEFQVMPQLLSLIKVCMFDMARFQIPQLH